MLTSEAHHSRASVALLLLGVALVAGILVVRSGIAGSGSTGALPADIAALGTKVVPISSEGTITRDAALKVADREYGIRGLKANAYLVALTNPNVAGGVTDRAFWIIKVEEYPLPVPIPYGASIAEGGAGAPTDLYIYVDAITGDWVMSHTP